MAIKIPNWIANSWKYFTGAVGAAAATALVLLMPHDPGQFARQIVVGMDTTMVIVGTDTTRHATTQADLSQTYRSAQLYDDGYRLHIWEYKTVNTLTGEVTPEILLTIAPPIGMQVNWKARAGVSELAREKIPEMLEILPVEKAIEIGWRLVVDTVEIDADKNIELKKDWTTDAERQPVRIAYKIEDIGIGSGEIEDVK
jgi:hypothetical protein